MAIDRTSPCKINLLLNVLGPRPDGYHDLETVLHPVGLCDHLELERSATAIAFSCNDPKLPTDGRNLVVRAAQRFLAEAGLTEGVRLRLDKRIPVAAGLGGGSGNAAAALLGLNELFENPLSAGQLARLASGLGADVPFFLQPAPALATGRGEHVRPLDWFPALRRAWLLLIHPGFGIPTAWTYQSLKRFPEALHGQPGRAQRLVEHLQSETLADLSGKLYNSLETPAFAKHPILALYQEFLRAAGAAAVLMSGSGSATFALTENENAARELRDRFLGHFGNTPWTAVLPVEPPR